jgi:hypothetical protein
MRGQWVSSSKNGKIIGNKITFYIDTVNEPVIYSGTVEGNTMKGTINLGGTWTAKR